MSRNYDSRGRGGRGRGRGRGGRSGRGGRGGFTSNRSGSQQSTATRKRSDNLKDPINTYTMGSTPAHLAEQMKITQVIIQYIQKTLKNGSDVVKALTTRTETVMTGGRPSPINKPKEPVYPTMTGDDAKDSKLKKAYDKEYDTYAPKRAQYDLEKAEQDLRLSLWIKKDEAYKEGMERAYAIVWGQCNDPLKEKIKNLSEFEKDIRNKPLELLKAIEIQSINYHEDKYDMSMALEAMRNLVNLHQGKDEPLSDYAHRIRTARDIMVTYIGCPITFDKQIRAKEKLGATAVLTEEQIEKHWERFMAHIMMRHANAAKYGTLYQEMENQILRDKNSTPFPDTLDRAETVLSTYKMPKYNDTSEKKKPTTKNGQNEQKSQQRSTELPTHSTKIVDELPDMTFAQAEGKCFICGEKGHYSTKCPKKSSMDKKDWYAVKQTKQQYQQMQQWSDDDPPDDQSVITTSSRPLSM